MKITDVCCAFIFDRNLLLAVQRGPGSDHPYQWEFPGGKVEQGERYMECIIREIREELSLMVNPVEELNPVECLYPGKLIRLIPFICIPGGEQINLTEHIRHKWLRTFDLEQLNWQKADLLLIQKNRTELLNRFGEYDKNR